MNQDSFFSIVDGDVRIIGLFQGHGEDGHIVSNAAMCHMLDYLRNRNDNFCSRKIAELKSDEICQEIRRAFKYTQATLTEDFEILRKKRRDQRKA